MPIRTLLSSFTPLVLATILGALCLTQAGGPGPCQPWELMRVPTELHAGLKALQAEDYPAASEAFDAVQKLKGDEKPDKSVTSMAKKLEGAAKLLADCQKNIDRQRFSLSALKQMTEYTRQFRRTFLYPYFHRLEDRYRKLGVVEVEDFEPPFESLRPIRSALDLDEEYDFETTWGDFQRVLPYATKDDDVVQQGLYAYHWKDTPELRGFGGVVRPHVTNWDAMKTLCFRARIADPKKASVDVYLMNDQTDKAYFVTGLSSWTGWKEFRIDLRRTFTLRQDGGKVDWNRIDRIVFSTRGGLSDFYVDDIYLIPAR